MALFLPPANTSNALYSRLAECLSCSCSNVRKSLPHIRISGPSGQGQGQRSRKVITSVFKYTHSREVCLLLKLERRSCFSSSVVTQVLVQYLHYYGVTMWTHIIMTVVGSLAILRQLQQCSMHRSLTREP